MKGSRPFTDDEIVKVLSAFKGRFANRDRALFLLGIKTGFRIGELTSLKLEDIQNGVDIVDRISVRRCNMKGKLEGRTVILNPEARKALGIWVSEMVQAGNSPDTYLFKSRQGLNQPISTNQAWKLLDKVFTRLGLSGSLGTHCMRKTFSDRMFDKLDHDLVKMQKALGHRNINSTVSYLSFKTEEIDQAIMSI